MAKNVRLWMQKQLETILPKKVFSQTDDGNNEQIPYKFPIITYSRISEKNHRAGQRTEIYQVTPWSDKIEKMETIKTQIMAMFNNATIDGYRCRCDV